MLPLRYHLISSRGRLILNHNPHWWRVEYLGWAIEQPYDDASPIKWPGFFEKTRRHAFGFEYATGAYVTAFTRVNEDTQFIPPFKPVNPGTMLRTTRQFELVVIPLWFVMLSAAVLPATLIGMKIRTLLPSLLRMDSRSR